MLLEQLSQQSNEQKEIVQSLAWRSMICTAIVVRVCGCLFIAKLFWPIVNQVN
jgi:hypothetical protein